MPQVNSTRYALLGMLNFQAMSGYDLKKAIDRSISFFWSENYGHIYPVLKDMEEEKLVTKQVEQTRGKPAKNVYSITDKGRQLLSKWVAGPARKKVFRLEILLKLFFGQIAGTDNMIAKVEEEKKSTEAVLTEFAEIERHILSYGHGKNMVPYGLLCLNYGKHFCSAVISWCDETLSTLGAAKNKREQ
jgi:PadR family transcriptional regulator AphA